MMATLLVIRGRIRHFYERYYTVVRGILRGLVVLGVLLLTALRFPEGFFSDILWVFPIIALVCGCLPDAFGILAIVVTVGIEVWTISPMLAVTLIMMIVIFFLIFGRKTKQQWYILLSVPTMSVIHMGFSVPVVAPLFADLSMIPALAMGIIVRFSLEGVAEYTATAQSIAGDASMFAPLKYLVDFLASNKQLLVALLAYTFTYIVIYGLRKANFRHAPQIAILVGSIVLYTIEMISNIIWSLELDLVLTSILVVVTMGIAYVCQFMHISLDYHGTRKLQFEDDEYYYYVTAIPKFAVAVGDKTVTRILPEEVAQVQSELKEEVEKALAEERGETQTDEVTEAEDGKE